MIETVAGRDGGRVGMDIESPIDNLEITLSPDQVREFLAGRWKNTRRPKNKAEGKLFDEMLERGLLCTKRGWPDFSIWDQHDNLLGVVEVKPRPHLPLKDSQSRMMRALSRRGIPCYRWSPSSGFRRSYGD